MDTREATDIIAAPRGRKLGVSGGHPCTRCGAIVDWRVERFCMARRPRFGGRIYCLRCQPSIPGSS